MPRKVEKRETVPEQSEQDQQENEAANQEDREDNAVILLHPGSSTLHLGLATTRTPHSLPHLIAYRGSEGGGGSGEGERKGTIPEDGSLVLRHEAEITPELESQRENGLASIQQSLAESRAAMGMGGCEVERGEYLLFNSRVQPVARESEELLWTDVSGKPRFVIGNEALYLPPNSGYVIFKPLRRGRLNVSPSCSLACVLSQLEDLWTKAIEDYLDIPSKDFKYYRVILLVSDVVDRLVLKELMNLLLLRMEFGAAFLHQESVCATYCAGLSSACVVNVGDEVTHISCVEEGTSNPNTRVALSYGGSDITRLFHRLLTQINLPYKECTVDSRLDGLLVQQLKESVCHLDPTLWGAGEHQFSVMSPSPKILLDYNIKMADEAIHAPMGVFFPSTFCLPDNCVLMVGQDVPSADREDIYDEGNWATEGQSQQVKSTTNKAAGVEPSLLQAAADTCPEVTKRLQNVTPGKILGLDQAIHLSIDCASSLEMKKKLYGSVLLIGGGLAFSGAANLLQARLELKFPAMFGRGTDNIEVFSNPRDLDPALVAWRGGGVLKCLDTCQELWIEKQEWEFSGVRLLRERAPFQY